MTSGNRRGLPMAITNEAAFNELGGLADYFLLHNRRIINRSDDSALRIINENLLLHVDPEDMYQIQSTFQSKRV